MSKLTEIQKKLKAPKNQFNSFGRYNYRSCEDILEAVKPLLDGAILTLSDELVNIGDRYYVKATATIKDYMEVFSVSAYAREPQEKKGMDESQITGTASSYARKYALNGLFLIDDTKDADTDEYKENIDNRQTKLETLEDFKKAIENSKTEKQLGFLYYRWKEKFADGSEEYKELQKLSSERKITIGNPDLKVGK